MNKKQKDGVRKVGTRVKKWEARWQVKGPDGKWHDRTRILGKCSEMTKTEAEDKRRRLMLEDEKNRRFTVDAEATFAEAWRSYEEHNPQWSEANRRSVVSIFKNHVLPDIGKVKLPQITKVLVQALLNKMFAGGKSKSAQHKAAIYIRATLSHAAESRNVDPPPRWRLKIASKKGISKRFLRIEEISSLLAACEQRDHLILRLCLVCGFRPSELFALRWDDVQGPDIRIDERASRYPKKEGKIKRGVKTDPDKVMYVFLPPAVRDELMAWRGPCEPPPRDFIFMSKTGGPLNAHNYLNRDLKELGEATGIQGANFQAMRRTCGTWLQTTGSVKDAQAHLRHTTPHMTLTAYMHVIPESVREAVEKLDQALLSGVKMPTSGI